MPFTIRAGLRVTGVNEALHRTSEACCVSIPYHRISILVIVLNILCGGLFAMMINFATDDPPDLLRQYPWLAWVAAALLMLMAIGLALVELLAKGQGKEAPIPPPPPPLPDPQTTWRNCMGMEFVLIPAGEFVMGSAHLEADRDEQPEHQVRIGRPFYNG